VRGLATDADDRLADCIGPPSPETVAAADNLLAIVEDYAARRAAQTFPCKRYIYDGRGDDLGRPFRVEYDG
jgi:hypothetical protein